MSSTTRAMPGFFSAQASHCSGVFLRRRTLRTALRMGHPTVAMIRAAVALY
jgi:hypothetical protein